MKKSIYSYTDYREYLRDFYDHGKSTGNGFSFRSMAQDMGFTSPNYLKLIIDGDRHLGRSSISKVSEGLSLKKLEQEYFSYLVHFSKAKTPADQNFYYGQITRMRSGKNFESIDDTQLAYYEQWYTPIIRELIEGTNSEEFNPAAIGRRISPPIHHKKVGHSVALLQNIGLIKIDEDGYYRHNSSILNSKNEVSSAAVKSFHKKMISLGSESIDTIERENREISAVTMRVSEDGFKNIKKRVQEFREEILQMAHDDRDCDQIAQLNFQLFPLTNSENSDA